MAAICRAVAVKVMESRSRRKQEAGEGSSEGQDEVMPKEEVFKASEKDEEANLMHPPEMPIVIDEVALEDILGVSYVSTGLCHALPKTGTQGLWCTTTDMDTGP